MTDDLGLFRWLLAAVIIGPTSIATALARGLLAGAAVYVALIAVAAVWAVLAALRQHREASNG